MNKIKSIYLKNKEIINYLIIGVLTTIVSLLTYYICVSTFLSAKVSIELQIANIISWVLSVTFAYVTNRKYVFESKAKNIFKECIKFFSSRLLTLLIDMVFMYLLVTVLGFNDKFMKIIVQIIIIILNYIISKFLVFRNLKTKINKQKKSSKIKVLQVISTMGPGGAQNIVLNYLKQFKTDKNIELKLLVLGCKTDSKYDKELKKTDYNVEYLNITNKKIPFIHRFININFYKKNIQNAINKYNPDIIHIHLFGTLKKMEGVLDKIDTKTIFYTLHSNPERFTGIDLKIAKKFFSKSNVIPICLNKEQAEIAKKHYCINRYEIAHNGVDYKKIKSQILKKNDARKMFNISKNDYVICSVGRLEPIKNYSFLLDVFRELLNLNKNSLLVFAGDGNEMEKLKSKANKLGIYDRVKFLGNVNNCTNLYCASDAFALTSISESSSLVLIEAQVCNVYSVISSGVPDESIITNKVRKMKKNDSKYKWAEALLDNGYVGKRVLNFDNYDLNLTIKNIKNIYLKYSGDIYEK